MELTQLQLYNEFSEEAMLNNCNYDTRRKDDLHFVECEIIDCERPDWWYAKFIGVRFLGIITYDNYIMKLRKDGIILIKEIRPVKVTGNTKITIGRDLPAKDVRII